LVDRQVKAIARRMDRDDVLFLLDEGPQVAVVHLTYSSENLPEFPTTQVYESLAEFEILRMTPDHGEYSF